MEYEYKLYVGGEHSTVGSISLVTGDYVDGATFTPGWGLWEGTTEPSTVVTVIASDDALITRLAEALRKEFAQDCILVTKSEVEARLV